VSASAALTGLIFVAVSINLRLILDYPALPQRVLRALLMLMLVLFTSTLGLTPGQSSALLGGELLALGAGASLGILALDVHTWRLTDELFRRQVLVLSPVGFIAAVCTAAAGATLLAHTGGGLYWLLPAILLAYSAALMDAWVLLIEIVR
jgi:modulator of FtsH protease